MTPTWDITVHLYPDGGRVTHDQDDGLEASARDLESLIREAVERTLGAEGAGDAEISLTLLGDEAIQALNREYLSRDRPTDVIAFSLGEEGDVLGDVYIGADQARRQGEELGIDVSEELVRLAIHGTLHVLGHDHPEDGDRSASPMYRLQERLVDEVMGLS